MLCGILLESHPQKVGHFAIQIFFFHVLLYLKIEALNVRG